MLCPPKVATLPATHPVLGWTCPCCPGWEPLKVWKDLPTPRTSPSRGSPGRGEERPSRGSGLSLTGALTSPPTPSPGLGSQAHSPCPHCCEQNGGAAGGGGAAPPLSSGAAVGPGWPWEKGEQMFTWLGAAWLKCELSYLPHTKRERRSLLLGHRGGVGVGVGTGRDRQGPWSGLSPLPPSPTQTPSRGAEPGCLPAPA